MSTPIAIDAIQHTLQKLSGKWRIPILTTLFQIERARYSALQQHLPKIGSKMLTTELKALEQLNLIERLVSEPSMTISYQLSNKGRSLLPVLQSLSTWGEADLPKKAMRLTSKNKHEINHFLTINI